MLGFCFPKHRVPTLEALYFSKCFTAHTKKRSPNLVAQTNRFILLTVLWVGRSGKHWLGSSSLACMKSAGTAGAGGSFPRWRLHSCVWKTLGLSPPPPSSSLSLSLFLKISLFSSYGISSSRASLCGCALAFAQHSGLLGRHASYMGAGF